MKITSKLTTSVLTATALLAMSSTVASANTYKIKTGDTLGEIAQTHKTTVSALSSINGLSNPNLIIAGEKLELNGYVQQSGSASHDSTVVNNRHYTTNQGQSDENTSTTVGNTSATSGWTTMEATAYDPQVAAGGQGTSIPTGTGVAANLSRYPKGTQLEIKYQDGHTESRVVNDTGSFSVSNPNQLDISMSNSSALQFGRQNISVRVVG